MTYDPKNDPNLTAYALGELEGFEAAEVRKLVDSDPAAARYVAEVRRTAELLEAEFAGEPTADAGLSDDQRGVIERAIANPSAVSDNGDDEADAPAVVAVAEPSGTYRFPVAGWAMKVAALIAIGAMLTIIFLPMLSSGPANEMAMSYDASAPEATKAYDDYAGKASDSDVTAADSQPAPGAAESGTRYRAADYEGRFKERLARDQEAVKQDDSVTINIPPFMVPDGAAGPVADAPAHADRGALNGSKAASEPAAGAPAGATRPTQPVAPATAPHAPHNSAPKPYSPAPKPQRIIAGAELQLTDAERKNGRREFAADTLSLRQSDEKAKQLGAPVVAELAEADDERRRLSDRDKFNREGYDAVVHNPFKLVADDPMSTFSIDVDTGSYTNIRRMLMRENRLPPAGAVRIEEMINYFPYYYDQPTGDDPFAANVEVAAAPWNTKHRLVRIGLQGKDVMKVRPAANLVFLIDVSGSMRPADKLPLVKESLRMLTAELDADDRVAMVVYAGAAGLVLDSTPVSEKDKILAALDRLESGGSTNGGAGIQLAYKVARENFIEGGVNRVILASDGDFNVGLTSMDQRIALIEQQRESGVFLSVLGFGTGNLQDHAMEQIANKGNGNYSYIDSIREARKVLVEQMGGTLVTIAKDVKIQVEFNPAQVKAHRLIGYENRVLAHQDFNDDRKDAGEIGSAHSVTALYEVVPVGVEIAADAKPGNVDDLIFQPKPADAAPAAVNVPAEHRDKLMFLKLRFKQPDGDTSVLRTFPVTDSDKTYDQASRDYKFAAAVAQFGMLLRNSPYKGHSNYDAVLELAGEAIGEDKGGYRSEFIELVKRAKSLDAR